MTNSVPMKKYWILFFAALTLCAPAAAETAAADFAAMSRAAERGKVAADQKDWDLAIGYFSEAQNLGPHRPENLMNLALAHRNAGHLLIAGVWLRAYLEALPESEKRQKVLALIDELEVKAQVKTRELLRLSEETAIKFPPEFVEDQRQAFAALAFAEATGGEIEKAYATGQKSGEAAYDRQVFLRYQGQILSSAHDYEAVERILAALTSPQERNALLYRLGSDQLNRGEEEVLGKTVDQMTASPERFRLLREWMTYLTREMKITAAETVAARADSPELDAELAQLLAAGYLKAGETEKARTAAREILERSRGLPQEALAVARILSGEGRKVLGELKEMAPASEALWEKAQKLYTATINLAWSGETALAREGCEALRAFAQEQNQPLTQDFAQIGCGYLAAEEGRLEAALAAMPAISPESRKNFQISLFWRLVAQVRLEDAAALLAAAGDTTLQAGLLHDLGKVYRDRGEAVKARELLEKSRVLAVHANATYVLKKIAIDAATAGDAALTTRAFREERLARWIGLARYFESQESLMDLKVYLAKSGEADLVETVRLLTQAASDWQRAAVLIHGVESWHARNP